MRKLLLTTAAVAAAIAGAVAGETDFGTFTDTRDGQTYKTVTIGKQTWMAQNLNYQTKRGSWCYKDKADSCKKYGRLYDWKTATTVCPKGWKLPSREDWDRLVETAGGKEIAGKRLKARRGWNDNCNGTDDYGFSALPCGDRFPDGSFRGTGYYCYWWTTVEHDYSGDAFYWSMGCSHDNANEGHYYKSNGRSVRCVADRP